MELAKSFEPHAIEAKWYPLWESRGYFRPSYAPGAPPFCIQLPPPNVTGTLHMGHAFQQTLMDVLIRYHRMRGDNTLWQVGTDHAGHRDADRRRKPAEGRRQVAARPRPRKFVERVWAWKQESGSTITNQMRRLGASGDWSRERFTMDEGLSAAVLETFVRLYDDGLIYRGKRLVNWDPKLGTAVSDLEGRQRGRERQALGDPLSARRHGPSGCGDRRRDDAAGDDAGRRRGRGQSRRRALRSPGRQGSRAAADRTPHSGDRRRLRRQGIRHRLREDHAGARFQRLADWSAPRPDADSHPQSRRDDQRQRAGQVSRPRPLRGAQGGARRSYGARVPGGRKSRTGWSCRAAGAPARSSSRC